MPNTMGDVQKTKTWHCSYTNLFVVIILDTNFTAVLTSTNFNFTLYILPTDGLFPKNVMKTNVYESESYSE